MRLSAMIKHKWRFICSSFESIKAWNPYESHAKGLNKGYYKTQAVIIEWSQSSDTFLGSVVSGWSCFHGHDCIENNGKLLALEF